MEKDAISLGLTRIVILVISIISLPLLVRVLGEDNYGLYVLIFGLVGLIGGLSNLGLGFTAMRKLPSCQLKKERAEFFYPQFWARTAIAICLFCLVHILGFYSPLGPYLQENNISLWPISLYILTFPLYSNFDLVFKFLRKIGSLNTLHLLLPFTYLMSLGVMLYEFERLTVNDVLLAHLVSLWVTLLFLQQKVVKLVGFKLHFYSLSSFKFDIRHGLPVLLTVILDQVISISDRYIIAYYLPLDNVGYYACAISLTSMLLSIPRVITVITQPLMSQLIDQKSLEKASLNLSKTAIYWLMVAIPATIGAFLLGSEFIGFYITQEVGENAGPILWVLFSGACFFGLFMIYSTVLFAGYRTDRLLVISAISAFVNVTLNLILLYFFADILMAATSTLIAYCIMFILAYRAAAKILDLSFDLKELLKILIGGAIAGVLVYLTKMAINSELGIGIIFLLIAEFSIVYLLILFFLKSELRNVKINYLKK